MANPRTDPKNPQLPEALQGALNRMFFSVVAVDPVRDTVSILLNRENPAQAGQTLSWSAYTARYAPVLTGDGNALLQKRFSSQALLGAARRGEREIVQDLPYVKGGRTCWVTVSASLSQDDQGDWSACLFIRQNDEEHLLRSIIDLYVYNTCDYFICLDMKHNSYVTFNGRPSGSPLPPETGEDYDAALEDYARAYVVPEDQDMCIHKMQRDYVRRQLEEKDTYSFSVGVVDTIRGYARKRLTYRYYDRQAEMVLLSRTDVTEIFLEEQARLKELQAARVRAETDPLTGLLNYGGILARVEEALQAGTGPAALLFLDLDNFKQVNDLYGHPEGDKLLWKVAQILLLHTGREGLQGRAGGDEFVVFLPHITDRAQAEACARHICGAVSSLTLPGDGSVAVSCSIGGALAPEDGRDYQTLVAAADRRAYLAKGRGKNTYQFEG